MIIIIALTIISIAIFISTRKRRKELKSSLEKYLNKEVNKNE